MSEGTGADHVLHVASDSAGARLDVFLAARLPDVSRARAQRLIDDGQVRVNDAAARASTRLADGDTVVASVPAPRPSHIAPEAIALQVVYEDADLLVIDKPRGMVVHPAPGAEDGTLVNALLAHCDDLSGVGGVERPGIVHRLDKDTTGLLMVAKNDAAHHGLQQQIQARTARRRYLALVWGKPAFVEAVVDAPIGRHPNDRRKMAVIDPSRSDAPSRAAVTEIRVVEPLGPIALLECILQTGRTHQIRVHCQFAGHPVVGDPVYGGDRRTGIAAIDARIAALGGQALHAHALSFLHPRTGEPLAFSSPTPPEMAALIDTLREAQSG